jgi:hypothetical protein
LKTQRRGDKNYSKKNPICFENITTSKAIVIPDYNVIISNLIASCNFPTFPP